MATLEEFKALRDGVPAEVQAELYRLFTADPEASFKRMVEIAAEGHDPHVEEVKGFLKQMDEDDEFDDFELDIVALAAIAGGETETAPAAEKRMTSPGMQPMRKWLFSGSPESV